MKEIGKIGAYLAVVVLLGSLCAPPLWWAGQWAIEIELIPQLVGHPFARYFNRSVMVVALGFLWPLLRWLGVGKWTELGLEPNPRRWNDLVLGVGLGMGSLLSVGMIMLLTERMVLRETISAWKIIGALGTGIAVPLIEEIFFRGALFGVLRRRLPWPRALAFLSVFFAVLHFMKAHPDARNITDVHWLSGFALWPYLLHQFTDLQLVLVGWVTLVLVGWILGHTVVRTRSLYLAMGLHGGWVFSLRAYKFSTHRNMEPSFWFGRDVTTGIVPILTILGVYALVLYLLRNRREAASAVEGTPVEE